MIEREYFVCPFVLSSKRKYLIWCGVRDDSRDGDLDVVVTDERGLIPTFASERLVLEFMSSRGIQRAENDGSVVHNFDVVEAWLRRPRMTAMPCDDFLAAWNLLGDISRAVGGGFDPERERTQKIYGKIFWGNNLPSMTPPGRCYVPLWTRREVRIMREVLGEGMAMMRSRLRVWRGG